MSAPDARMSFAKIDVGSTSGRWATKLGSVSLHAPLTAVTAAPPPPPPPPAAALPAAPAASIAATRSDALRRLVDDVLSVVANPHTKTPAHTMDRIPALHQAKRCPALPSVAGVSATAVSGFGADQVITLSSATSLHSLSPPADTVRRIAARQRVPPSNQSQTLTCVSDEQRWTTRSRFKAERYAADGRVLARPVG